MNDFIACRSCKSQFTINQMKEPNRCPYCSGDITDNPQLYNSGIQGNMTQAGQQYGNPYNGAPPAGQQYGNTYNGAPPAEQQYGNTYNGAPPVGQQYGSTYNPMQAQMGAMKTMQNKQTLIVVVVNAVLLFMNWFSIPLLNQVGSLSSLFGGSDISSGFSIFDASSYFSYLAGFQTDDPILFLFKTILAVVPIALLILYGLFAFLKITNNKVSKVIGLTAHAIGTLFGSAILGVVTYTNVSAAPSFDGYYMGNMIDLSIFFYLFFVVSIAGFVSTIKEKV